MATRVKIKIFDDVELRTALDREYEIASQIKMCKYALALAKHILEFVQYENIDDAIIQEGFKTNEEWQRGNARMHDVRQIGFRIHQMAKENDNLLMQTSLRVVGQAVATGHMKEHAMVASDYAIKVINIKYPNDLNAVQQERKWQIDTINSIKDA
jgi:hypothetical protein